MSIIMYYHGGSKNHGCEAIVRSTAKILQPNQLTLYSSGIDDDCKYGVDKIVSLKNDSYLLDNLNGLQHLKASVLHKLTGSDYYFYTYGHKQFFENVKKGDVCLSIGGDNYCYKGQDILGYYNQKLHKIGAKTVLWGCSIDPDVITDSIVKDLASYDLIIAREKISYNFLKNINKNTYLFCDPAFQLDSNQKPLPDGFIDGKTIGINASPLAAKYGNKKMFLENYHELVQYIIDKTDYQVALIPHVVQEGNDDRTTLQELYDSFSDKSRLVMVSDADCTVIKGYISRCKMFIGARTHATIAAYSSCVPTIVTGYSVKAKGIACELFGTDENYVVPVQSLTDSYGLKNAFIWMIENYSQIKIHLNSIIPDYKMSILQSKELINQLL